ncbi:MAG: protein-methionine-sulfoxide reductase heme-binding subunit MsrQ [Nitratireductor sp.]|nr:protein-methionine-sulfoxide reductase heme-binding subunit MsrQ [Nitratireductor sp.]MCB1460205.1 protein-methionine-sulfoxide reductase heme-binding subunit MsrQ [Nitratireductor sp.]
MALAIADPLNQRLKRVPVWPLYAVALIPAAWAWWQALSGQAGPNPVRALEHGLGIWAFRFMIAALIVTPLRDWTGISLLRFRRMLGLTAFWYALMHLGVWLALDRQFDWNAILGDLVKRPYIIVGMLSFLALLPMAITSTDGMIRRLGAQAWNKLHRLAYPAAVLMVLHYLWLVKSWTAEPLSYAAIMTFLLAIRLLPKRKPARPRRPAATAS